MKQFSKLFFAAAVAALGLASCAKEVAQVEPPKDNLVTVHFGATAGIEGATKATLTTEDELTFTSAWENKDALSVEYSNDNGTAGTKGTVSASWAADHFEAKMPEYHGTWDYNVVYPAPDAESKVDFGSARTQKGNVYNSKYDLMKGSAIEENADAGKTADGKDIVFNMTRQTAIAYFHLTSTLDEEVKSAKLSVTDGNIASSLVMLLNHTDGFDLSTKDLNEITITFEEGTAPKASDFQLWYNVLPTAYTSMSLEVKTANHTLTLNKNKGGNFVAGKLYKIHKDNVTWTENVTFFYESFDSCDKTGGNDGEWNNISGSPELSADNTWSTTNAYSANACARFGSSKNQGSATTPALGINTSTATLSFKAGAWVSTDEKTEIKITANNGGTVEPSTITLKKGEWTDYTCTISGATETTSLTFAASQASKNRFFLDEVMVYYGNKPVVKHTQQISFSKTSVECYINDTFTEPVLSGDKTSVTYSSSDEKVATVNAASGKVTILSAGKTEITATAEESEEYKTATAKYTLTVNKQTQNLSFEKGTYSVLLADKDSFPSPVVNGAKTPVSYSITLGEGVAQDAITIDPKTGKVTINAVGTATITATAAETEEYKAASANYVLTVTEKDNGEELKTYTLQFGPKYNKKPISSYSTPWTVTCDGFTWDMANWNNNNNVWNYVKAGSKKNASVATITTNTTMPEAISTVTMTIDAITATNVNFIKLEVLPATGTTAIETISGTIKQGDCVFQITKPQTGCKYKISVDCKKSNNGIVQVSKVVYTNYTNN